MGTSSRIQAGAVMGRKGEEKRQRIIDAANTLFYHKGFTATSFADIADDCDVPKGNFYFYFRTKEELLDAVIRDRSERLAGLLDDLHKDIPDPRARLHRIADVPFNDRHEVAQYGCPMGTLSAEIGKLTPFSQNALTSMYSLLLMSMHHCLAGMGLSHDDADHNARHMLTRLQGAANLAQTFKDENWLEAEIADIHDWIDSL
ncbi:TetR/AcrR family transcriptional regulator [Magnetovibrio sp.]|uniref:TetR/AcrR family transcriptional regulator n=1 Tax=Magnetovibrio sp. TaxID=2024836 RepID=UPI002F95A725